MEKIIAAFDFDGTLINVESDLYLIKLLLGNKCFKKFYRRNFITLICFRLNVFSEYFLKRLVWKLTKGKSSAEIEAIAETLYQNLVSKVNEALISRLTWHLENNHHCIIVSRAFDVILFPWLKHFKINSLLATRLEIKEGYLTGKMLGKSCNGYEKVRRIFEHLADKREKYTIYAYGNSVGDKAMLDAADFAYWVANGEVSLLEKK